MGFMGVITKLLVHWGVRNKKMKANGGAKEKRMCLKSNKSEQLPRVYMGFYAKQISMSVKSAGPIAWSWK